MKKNEVDLRLIICDFEGISHDDITKLAGVQPSYQRIKGTPRNSKSPASPLWPNNLWSMDSGLGKHADFETQMNALLDVIEGKKEVFKTFCTKYHCEFACALLVYRDNGESSTFR
ncbi:DUF4279 domain-containing protein [Mucilaginibacter sp.]|uniref:DUF4279 domain-containing protein n=1 Tax=Mucilaginibacter sp. TaxID=1882438 RepID=UPI003266FCB1